MKIMIDILHPFDVHLFKNFIYAMKDKGHEIVITSREKDVTNYLLNKFDIKHINISCIGNGPTDLVKELISRTHRFLKIAKKSRPDILLGVMGPTIAPAGKLLNIPAIVFYGTEHAKITNSWVYPLATEIVTQSSYRGNHGKKHTKFKGFFELAYLHPKYFTPDQSVLNKLGINKFEKYAILRFVSWQASHDIGKQKINVEDKRKIVKKISKYMKTFITSEAKLPSDLKSYQLKIPFEKIHDVLSFATLYFGDGATMAAEAALLGTPSVYANYLSLGFLEELEKKYEVVYNFEDANKALSMVSYLLESNENLKKKWNNRRRKIIEDSTDVTKFMIEVAEKYNPNKIINPENLGNLTNNCIGVALDEKN